MRDMDNIDSYYERLLNEFSHFSQENSPCNDIENVSIIVNKKRWKKRKKHNVFEHAQQPTIAFRLSRFSKYKKQDSITKTSSMPELNKCTRPVPPRNKSGHRKDTKQYKYKQSPFQSKFIANVVSEHRFDNCFMNLFNYPSQTKWKIYRCQLGAVEDSCCCSCNSDAMFEVMKGLYDCYKAQNCDNCCCVLCSNILQEERKLGEFRKSLASIARDKVLDGKTAAEKEKILNEMAKSRLPLPTGKTASEKALIDKTRKELGLPPSPKNAAEKAKMRKAEAAGIITPLEGKNPAQKEKILRAQANFGLPLPEGRTASEKALIDKIKAKKGPRSVGKSEFKEKGPILGARMRKAKADGFMTPLINKTPADRETILKELANRGIPLPEGQSPSEKNIINKIRTELGLPIEPATKAIRDKHDEAAIQGILLPLEGKTPTEKESILQGQHNMGIPLPIGRTPSEKALIARIMATPRPPSLKTAGLLTSITGKSPEEKDKILRGRAMKGLLLPEGKSASEKKLINKVRADLGLPKEPKTKSIRDKHEQAAKAGLLQPLEGKTPAEKEKILKGLHDLGIPLPEGRSPSEKAIIAKVKASPRAVSAVVAPSEKMRRAKAEGLLTPLKGKTPEQKERILKGLAMTGIPLPEGQSPSEKKLIDKVRADLGLPKEPKTKSIRDKHEQAAKAGLLQPLEGKTPAEKEKTLQGLHDLGIPLPEGRTPSEKALIAKVAESSRHPSRVVPPVLAPSEQMRRTKAEGLLTPLKGKTPEQKEKILRALANRGIPLPEAQTPSEKKLVDKVRADLGLPREPETKSIRDKHEQAAKAGLLQPLEGKTPAEKEKTLKGLHDLGIPLPEGRTPSEKALIAKVAAASRHPSRVIPPVLAPSEQMRRAKAEGLLTPLTGKTPEQKEKILKALAKRGIPLPEGQSPSEKKLIDKVRADLGLPTEPKTKSIRDKHEQAAKAGLLQPLEGKTPAEKEKTLKGLHDLGIPLPEGRTPSEKALIAKVAAASRHPSRVIPPVLAPSEHMRRAKAEGLLTPLTGKTPEQKEKILKALAKRGIPLPEGQTPSEKKLVDKVRADLGLPTEPKTKSIRDKHEQAAKAGLLQPLEGKTPAEQEKILQGLHELGIPLPEGRTPSEKALIAKVRAGPRAFSAVLAPSEQMRRAKAEGLLTPLKGKTPEQKEKILKALANRGIPLPEGQTPSEKKLVGKVRADLGLPKEPKTKSIRDKHDLAAKAGLLQPLEGKTPAEKEKILKGLNDLGIPLPEGRTPSEKALIAKVAAASRHPSRVIPPVLAPSEQMRSAKAEGLLTPLTGKTPEKKEKILKALAKRGIPLPEGQTPSEKKLIDKVRADLGLPTEPKTKSIRDKHEQAAKAGLLQPLEGKTPAEQEKILQGLHDLGIPLPIGRTPSEKALIAKLAAASRHPSRVIPPVLAPSEQMRSAKAEGLLTPLTGKTPEKKEKILKALAKRGIPLPEGQTPSEKKLIDKVRADLGLPTEPKTKSIRDKHEQAAKAGLLQPLEGKTPAEQEKILQGLHDLGIPLPIGRTPSEKALIAKLAAASRHPSRVVPPALAPSEQMRRAKAEGLLTPLKGKTPEQKEKILRALANRGIPLPEAQSPSEKKLFDKVRADLGLPKEPETKSIRDKHEQAAKAGLLQPLEGKTPAEKEKTLKALHDLGIPLPEGRTPSERTLIAKVAASSRHPSRVIPPVLAPSEQMRRAKAEGLLTPLTGKTPEKKEKILKALAKRGIPLPEGQTPSEKKLVDKVRADLGLPIEPKTKSIRDKHEQAAKAGLLQPLEGKTPAEQEKILQGLHDLGIPLPVARTPSEKALIAKVAAASRHPSRVIPPVLAPSEQMRRAKAEGLLTPLTGKTPAQKEKILKALANRGIPLPEAQSPSEQKLVDKVRADLGLPKEPKTKSIRDKHDLAAKAGLLQPLEGKTPAEKEKILKGLNDLGIPLPEGRTTSEKALIAKVTAASRHPSRVIPPILAPSEQMRRAKAEGLLTPLTGKTPEKKEKILKALAKRGIPLPEGQTPSEKKLVDKVRADLGLPTEPKTKSIRDKHEQAAKAGLLQPLEGKTPAEQEKILQGLHELGIPLPEGRTPSEKALIAKVKAGPRALSAVLAPSEQMRRAKAEGLLTPLKGKTPEQKEKILKALANRGIPLPEGQTPSEKKLVGKVRADLGLPKEPKTKSIRDKHDLAAKAGLLQPLEGKTPAEKEKILKGLNDLGIPLPEGRTPSEKALIAKVMAASRHPSRAIPPVLAPSEQMRRAKAEGLLTPLTGKTPEKKEKILRALAKRGIPLPEGQTPSEKKLVDKVRADLGLPTEPKTKSIRDKHEQAAKAGLLQPLEGKTPAEKEKVLKGLHDLGIPLPEGRSLSEKALIAKVKASPRAPPTKAESLATVTSDKIRKAKAAGLFTPLANKTPEQKEKILQGLAEIGLPLPEGKTPSEKALIDKIKKESGIPERTPSEKLRKAKAVGLLTPLEGKSPDQKEKILRGRVAAGLPLPMYKTPSEKALIQQIKDDTGYVTPSPSERLRRAKGAGLVTPLKGKTPSLKEKILRGMKAAGVPIPEGETPSEKLLISRLISRPLSETQTEKLRAAKAAGLLTPLEGKTPAQKEKIVEGLARAGLPLPEGKTKSEKSMIARVKARTPPEGKTLSEKSIIRKAKAAGLFTPITGKAPAEKERILKGLAEAGLPLPVGRTESEKDLVKKIRAEAGLPIEPTPSEKKGKIRKKEKKVGVSASKRAAGIDVEEFEDIIKTTTCDRGCGCDKKKIKFKHSYVKIRVTSPDISSFCDCPGECVPGVKSGAFVDNEGIKVTIGSAVGIPSYSMECINQVMLDEIVSNIDLSTTRTNYHNNLDNSKKPKYKVSSDLGLNNSNKLNYILSASSSDMSHSTRPYRIQSENIHGPSSIAQYQGRASKSDRIVESLKGLQSLDDIYKEPTSKPNSTSSYETILIIKNDMSLSTSTSNSMDSTSLISVIDSSISSSSAHYSDYESTNDLLSINSLDGPTTSDDAINNPEITGKRDIIRNIGVAGPQQYTILRMSQLKANFGNEKLRKTKASSEAEDPIVLFNKLPSKLDVSKIMFKIMSKKRFAAASSIFIVVPMSDDDEEQGSSNCVDSITSIPSSEYNFTASTTSPMGLDLLRTSPFTEHDEQVFRKGKKFYMRGISSSNDTETRLVGMTKDEFCQISTPNQIARKMPTTDRACSSYKDHYAANVIPRQITPVFRKDNSSSWFRLPGMCKTCSESSTCNTPPCFGSRFITVLPNYPRQHGRTQQNQKTNSPSLCGCPPDDFEKERFRSAKVQKPSIASVYYEGDTAPKKGGWFRSRKAASSELVCDIPPCSAFSSSPVPADHRRPRDRIQQHQTTVSTSPCVCPPDDSEVTSNPSPKRAGDEKAGKSWFRRSSASDTPPCFDPSFSSDTRQRGRSQQNQKINSPSLCGCPPDGLEQTKNRSAKVQKPSISSIPYESDSAPKKAGWFRSRKATSSELVCDIPPCSDLSSSLVPADHRRPRGRSQPHKTAVSTSPCVCPPDDSEETSNSSAKKAIKAGKSWFGRSSASNTPPCFDPSFSSQPPYHPRQHGRTQQNQKTNSPSLCGCPPDDLEQTKNRSAKVQKPSISSMPYDTAPKKAGKSFSWSRLCKRKAVASDTPPCSDPSFSPAPSNRARQRDRSQHNKTPESHSCCSCPPDDYKETRNPSAKVQKPSIESIPRPETPKKSGKSFSWSRLCKPKAVACDIPPCSDPSLTPEPLYHPRQHGRTQQNQKTNTPSLCGCPPDGLEETKNRSAKVQKPSISSMPYDTAPKKAGKSFSWSRLCKRKAVASDTPPCSDPSFSPAPSNRARQRDRSQHNKTPESHSYCSCPPDDYKETRNPSAKVQKPSIESIPRPEAPKKSGKSFSWSRLCKPKAVACDTPPCSDPSFTPEPLYHPRQHGRTQQNQKTNTPSLCGCLPDGLEETKNRSAKVQKPSISSMPYDTAPKKAGKSFSWSRLCKRKAVASDTPPCSDPSFSPAPSNRARQRDRSQHNKSPESHSCCSCPPDNYKETRNPSAKVQKPSIESIPRPETPKKSGKSFSWSRLCKPKAVACDTPPCSDPSFTPEPLYHPRQHGRTQQNQKTNTPSLCGCLPDGLEETKNRSAKVQKPSISSMPYDTAPKKAGKSFSWSRLCKRKAVASDTPLSSDPSFSPAPSNRARQRDRSQHNKTPESHSCCSCPPDDYKETRNPSAKVQKPSIESIPRPETPKKSGKSFSWSRLCKPKAVACDTPPCSDPSFTPEPLYHPRQHGRTQQNQKTNTPSLCGCPPDGLEETTNRYDASATCICPPDKDTAPRITGKSFSWSRFCKRKASVACETPPRFGPMISPVPSNRGRQRSRNQQNQPPKSPSSCGCLTDELQESPSIESMRTAAKKAGIRFSWSRLQCKNKACDKHQCFEPNFSPVPSNRPRQRGSMSPGDYEETRNSSPKVKKPSSTESLQAAAKKAGTCWLRLLSFLKGPDTLQCFDRSSSPVPPHYPGHHGQSQETQTPASVCGCPSGDLKDTRNPSGTAQKPSHKKAGVGSGWYRLPCIRKALAKDPEISKDFESPKSIKLLERIILSERKEDKQMSPKELESPEVPKSPATSKLMKDKIICGCKNDENLRSQMDQQTASTLKDPNSPKDLKSPETSKQKEEESDCVCDQDKPMSPKWLESPKNLVGQSKLLTSIKKSISKINETLRSQMGQQTASTLKDPSSPKDLKSPETSKQKEEESDCVCNQDKPMSPKWLESPKNLVGQSKLLTSIKKSISKINETLRSQMGQQTASTLKDPSSPKDLKSPETGKQKEEESDCVCKQDKPMSPKWLESPKNLVGQLKLLTSIKKSISKINETLGSQMGQQTASTLKDPSSPKDLKSPETSKQKEEESDCMCNQDKLMSPKWVESPKYLVGQSNLLTSIKKSISKINETLRSQMGQQTANTLKDPSIPKDLKSPETSKQKEEESDCVCNQDKPMIPEDPKSLKTSEQKEGKIKCVCKEESLENLTSPETSKQEGGKSLSEREEDKTGGKVTCKCKTEKPKKKTETEPVGQSIPRQRRCPPQLPPVILGLPPVETPEGYLYEGIGPSCKWLDTGEIKRLRSELTQSTSGFKACKRHKPENSEVRVGKFKIEPEEHDIKLDFGEAIRYFATMNPECFGQLMKEELESQRDAEENKVENEKKLKKQIEKEKRKIEKARKKAEKEAKKGIINKTTTTNEDNTPISYETTEFSDETESVGSGWYRLPCIRKAPAKDPEISKDSVSPKDLEGPKSSELIESKILSERKVDKPTSPNRLESAKNLVGRSKLLTSIKTSISKINETLKSQVGQQASSKPKDPSRSKDLKSPETRKEDKPMSPKELESSNDPKSPKTSKLKDGIVLCGCNEDKPMSPKELESSKDSKRPETSELIESKILSEREEDKLMSPKEFESSKDPKNPETRKSIGSKILSERKKDKLKSPKRLESPKNLVDQSKLLTSIKKSISKINKTLKSQVDQQASSKSKDRSSFEDLKSPETGKEDKPMSPKGLESSNDPKNPKTSKLKDGIVICGCNEDKPINLKDLQSSKSSERAKTGILKEGIKLCGCKEDKPMSPKELESSKDSKRPETSKLKESKILSEREEDKPMSPKEFESSKDPKSPETRKSIGSKILSERKKDKSKSPKRLESPKNLVDQSKLLTSIKKSISKINETLKSQMGQQASGKSKDRSSFKDLKSPETGEEDKRMSPKELESSKDSKRPETSKLIESKILSEREEDKPMSPKEFESSKNPKSPETRKSIGNKILSERKKDKSKSPKRLESPKNLVDQSKLLTSIKKSISKINETLKSQMGQQASSKSKDRSSFKDLKSPETGKEDKPMSSKDSKRPETSKLIESKIISEREEDKPTNPKEFESSKDPKSPETGKLIENKSVCACKEEILKLALGFICLCQEHKPIQEPEPAKKMVRLSDPIVQQPAKPAEGISPVPQKLASTKTGKNDKPMSPKELESSKDPKSPETSKLIGSKILSERKEDKPKELERPNGSKNPKTSKLKKNKVICACDEDKPIRPTELESPKTSKSICTCTEEKLKLALGFICPCQEHNPIQEPEPAKKMVRQSDPIVQQPAKLTEGITPVPQTLASTKTGKEDKPMSPKELESSKDPKSPETSKLIGSKILSERKEDKTMSPKGLESPKMLVGQSKLLPSMKKTISKMNETLKSQVGQQAPSTPKDPSSPKDSKSPETDKQKEGNSVCMCNEDEPISSKDLERQRTSNIKTILFTTIKKSISKINESLKSQVGQQAASIAKDPSSPKDLQTYRGKLSECEEDMTEGKVRCKNKTEKQKKKKVPEPVGQPIPRQKRCPRQLPPVILGLPPVETPEGYLYEGIGPSCKWLDTGEIKRLRSELTQSTSGFKACKRHKPENSEVRVGKFKIEPPEDNIELEFGEAFRYFATMHPERFRQLMKEELESRRNAEVNKVENDKKTKMIKARKKAKLEAKKGIINKTTTTTNEDNTPISYETTEFSDETESKFPQGFKFSVAVKDGPTGLAGVKCKDMSRGFLMVRRNK